MLVKLLESYNWGGTFYTPGSLLHLRDGEAASLVEGGLAVPVTLRQLEAAGREVR
jgi:hypothetical protein